LLVVSPVIYIICHRRIHVFKSEGLVRGAKDGSFPAGFQVIWRRSWSFFC